MVKVLRQIGFFWLVGVGLLAGMVLLLWPMVQQGYPSTHSTQFNLSWAFQYQRQFFGGQFYPRWLEFSNFGFGNATFAFYPPLCMVVTLPFRILGLEMPASLVASMGLAMVVMGPGLYALIQTVAPRPLALILAVMGMAGPYWLVDIYQRGAIGEVWAIALLPWIFWALLQVLCRPGLLWPIWAVAISYGLLVLSHLPTLLLFTLIVLPLPWVLQWRDPFWPKVGRSYLGLGLGLGWSAFFLVPAFLDQRLIQVDSVNFAEDYFPQYRLMVSGLSRLQPLLTDHWFESGLLGYWSWMVAVVAGAVVVQAMHGMILLLGRWLGNRVTSRKEVAGLGSPSPFSSLLPSGDVLLYGLGASLVPLLMMTDLLSWVYDWVLPLQRIQFSWRWMGITAVTVPWLLGSLAGWGWPHKSWRSLILTGIAVAVIFQVGLGWQVLGRTSFQPQDIQTFHTLSAAKQFPIEPQQRPGTSFLYWHWIFPDGLALVDVPEYRAHGVTFPMPPPSVDPLVRWQGNLGDSLTVGEQGQNAEGNLADLQVERWSYGYRRFRAVNPTDRDQFVVLRTFYYPAWWVEMDGRLRSAEHTRLGQMQVRIPPGAHQIQVRYLGTPMDWLGWLMTGLTVVLLVKLRWVIALLGLQPPLATETLEETKAC